MTEADEDDLIDDLKGLLERPTAEAALIEVASFLEPYGLGKGPRPAATSQPDEVAAIEPCDSCDDSGGWYEGSRSYPVYVRCGCPKRCSQDDHDEEYVNHRATLGDNIKGE